MPALIFDCDGVLADTERDGHLPAFNEMFAEFGVPVQWTSKEYANKVTIGGGKERMRSIVTPELLEQIGEEDSPSAIDEMVARWHRRKTEIYTDRVNRGLLPARPGIARIVAEAHEAGWALAVASTSATVSVESVLRHVVGADLFSRFSIFAGDAVPAKKPDPAIYLLAIDQLGAAPDEVVVIEDSGIGVLAATRAGLRTVATVSGYTADDDFTPASLTLTSLGDPEPGEPAVVLDDPYAIDPGRYITLDDLARVLKTPNRSSASTQPHSHT